MRRVGCVLAILGLACLGGCGFGGGDSAGAADAMGGYGYDAYAASDVGHAAWDTVAASDAAAPGTGGGSGACTPACDGRQCGPDGCGGSCGWCPGILSCQSGACAEVPGCTPECAGRMAGEPDGCNGVCCGSGTGIGLKPGGAQDVGYFRRLVGEGKVPEARFLPVEGWLNEHDTPLPPPQTDRLITLHGFAGVTFDPGEDHPLVALQLGMNSGLAPETIEKASFNLAIVVDRSGSMGDENKLEAVKDGLLLLVDQLDEKDRLAIVIYNDAAQVLLPSRAVTDREHVKALIRGLAADGSTNLFDGMVKGYEQVLSSMPAMPGAQHRVILLSDGMANTGPVTSNAGIEQQSKTYNDEGVGITTIGVGTSFNFELMYALANLGSGNFYFIDSPAGLIEVFVEEIKYLLTPVAENLRVWFSLPADFGVDRIYGFEFRQVNGEFVLLGPAAQYDPTPEGEKPPPGLGGGVSVSTVFASKKNGLVIVKVTPPGIPALSSLQPGTFATVSYSYVLSATQAEETHQVEVPVGGYEFQDGGGFEYFSSEIVRRNLCILRVGLAMERACADFHDPALGPAGMDLALQGLDHARFFCEKVIGSLKTTGWSGTWLDPMTADLELMDQLRQNIQAVVPPVQAE